MSVVPIYVTCPSRETLRSPKGAVEPREDDVHNDHTVGENLVVARVSTDVEVSLESDEHERLYRGAAAREYEERVGVTHLLPKTIAAEIPGREGDRHDVCRDDEVGQRKVDDERVAAHVQGRLHGNRTDEEEVAERAEGGNEAKEDEENNVNHDWPGAASGEMASISYSANTKHGGRARPSSSCRMFQTVKI